MNGAIDDRDVNWVLPLVRDAAVADDDAGPGDRPTTRPAGRVTGTTKVVAVWVGRREVHLTVDGPGDAELVIRLDSVLERLLADGAGHLVVDLHRLVGDDHDVLELLAATCHRVWGRRGVVEIGGLRDCLATSSSVTAFPEVFGVVQQG